MARQRKLAYLALLAAAAIWGIAPPLIKYTLNFISPTTFLFYRFLIASVILLPLLIYRLAISRLRFTSPYLLVGLIGTPLNLFLLFEGLKKKIERRAN